MKFSAVSYKTDFKINVYLKNIETFHNLYNFKKLPEKSLQEFSQRCIFRIQNYDKFLLINFTYNFLN